MTIKSIEITDNDWKLNKTSFGHISLLVGISGAGKTKTTEIINKIYKAATSGAHHAAGCSWRIFFQIDRHEYYWEGSVAKIEATTDPNIIYQTKNYDRIVFKYEKILLDNITIIDRDYETGEFKYNNKTLPQLKWTESALSLLEDEAALAPLMYSLKHIIVVNNEFNWSYLDDISQYNLDNIRTIDDLRESLNMPLLVKSFILKTKFEKIFKEVEMTFYDTFPFIEKIDIIKFAKDIFFPNKPASCAIIAKEKGMKKNEWFFGNLLSTGMLKTLKILLELALAPKGTLILIDEFENSLGINCLPQIADSVNLRQRDLQFILTSHHPYVINNIDWRNWKLVTRRGNTVTIHNTSDIPALNTASTIERFELLINAPQYEKGIE
ncbi:MAG: ATP-binding protein [Magnetococcales bacterium]|nr:ATP-binding protein [Magnetococcales bacterium]